MGSIQKQGLINTVIIYIGVALGFFNVVIVQPHYLTPEELGLTKVVINFGALLTTFLLLGASSTCIKYFASFRDSKTGHHGFLGVILLITLAGLLIGGCFFYILHDWILDRYKGDSPLFINYFFWEFPLAAVMTLSMALNSYCYSLLKITVPSFLNDIWVRIALLIFTFAYSFHLIDLDYYVASIFVTYLSQLLFLIIYIFRIDKPSFKIDWSFFKQAGGSSIIKFSMLMTLTALSSLSMKFLDSIMIGAYMPIMFAGIYSIGAFIAQFIETPLYSLERVASIKIAHGFQSNNMVEIEDIYRQSVRVLFLIGGFLAVCIITNIHAFLSLLPSAYLPAAGVTIIMTIGSVINMGTGVNTPIISNSSKYYYNMIFLLILLAVAVGLNMILIPKFGIEGAAIATGLASTLFNLMKFFFIWKNFGFQPYDIRTLKTIIVIAISFLFAFYIPVPDNAWISMAIKGTLITAVYGGLTLMLNIIPEHHHLLYRLIGKRK